MPSARSLGATGLERADVVDARFRRPLMSFFLRRVGSRAEAEDLTQQVFLRLFRGTDRSGVENPAAFVFKIAANLLRDRRRAEHRRGDHVEIDEALRARPGTISVEETTPERVLLARESLSEVLASLDELGERTRDMFILFRLENMKQQDIAALYGCSRSTVEKHVTKAVLHLAATRGRG